MLCELVSSDPNQVRMGDDEEVLKLAKLRRWRVISSYIYDKIEIIRLDWPTLTCQWALDTPYNTTSAGEPLSKDPHENLQAMVATYTSRRDPEYIRQVIVDTSKIFHQEHILDEWYVPNSKNTKKYTQHEALCVTKLRQCPHLPEIFAGLSDTGMLYVYNRNEVDGGVFSLSGHSATGFGLAWQANEPDDVYKPLKLVSGANDGKIIMWEINPRNLSKSRKLAQHKTDTLVNEITWDHKNQIVAALDTGSVLVLAPADLSVVSDFDLHKCPINCASLSPFKANLLATGTDDGAVTVWDIKAKKPSVVYQNSLHTAQVTSVRWSPHLDGVLATAGVDCVVYILDIGRAGAAQSELEAEEGPPEMVFKHLGHLDGLQVNEIDWHPVNRTMLLSCDGKSILMAWQPFKGLFARIVDS